MKTVGNKKCRSAMTRVEVLVLICIALIAAYLVVRYQRTGELLEIGWRKKPGKTNIVAQPMRPSEIIHVTETDAPGETTEVYEVITNNPVSTNLVLQPSNEPTLLEIAQMRLAERQRQMVRVPTNAVLLPAPSGRAPGVRIAYP